MAEDITATPDAPVERTIALSSLQDSLGSTLGDALQDLLEGTAEDIRMFATAIAQNMVRAAAVGDHATVKELSQQLPVLAEINRVRIVKKAWETVIKVVDTMALFSMRVLNPA
jgi:hypothetical protein